MADKETHTCSSEPVSETSTDSPSADWLETRILREVEELLRAKNQEICNLATKNREIDAENRAKNQVISDLAAKSIELETQNQYLRDFAVEDTRIDALTADIHCKDGVIGQLRLKLQTKDAEAKRKQAWMDTEMASLDELQSEAKKNEADLVKYNEIKIAHNAFMEEMKMRG